MATHEIVGNYADVQTAEKLRQRFSPVHAAKIFAITEPIFTSRLYAPYHLNTAEQATMFGACRISIAVMRQLARPSYPSRVISAGCFEQADFWIQRGHFKFRQLLQPHLFNAALQLTQDPNGNTYHYGEELVRDFAADRLLCAQVYGETTREQFVDQAIALLDKVRSRSGAVSHQAAYEAHRIRALTGQQVDESDVIGSYDAAQLQAQGNTERLVTNAARLVQFRTPRMIAKGLNEWRRYTLGDKKSSVRNLKILVREAGRAIDDRTLRHAMDRNRPPDFDTRPYLLTEQFEHVNHVLTHPQQ